MGYLRIGEKEVRKKIREEEGGSGGNSREEEQVNWVEY
jgi:hypothetical protein